MPYTGLLGGEGATDAMTQILTQRELDRRNALLDELNAQNVHSEIDTRADTAATNKVYREAQAQNMKDAARDRLVKRFLNVYPSGADVDPGGMDPDMFKTAQEEGLLSEVAPSVRSSMTAIDPDTGEPMQTQLLGGQDVPKHYISRGTSEQQIRNNRASALASILNDPEVQKNPLLRTMIHLQIAGGDLEKGVELGPSSLWEGPAHHAVIGRDGSVGDVKDYPSNTTFSTAPAPAPTNNFSFVGVSPEGTPLVLGSKSGSIRPAPVPGGGPIGPKPSAASGGPGSGGPLVKTPDMNALRAALGVYQKSQTGWSRSPTPEATAGLAIARQRVIEAALPANPPVLREIAAQIASNPKAATMSFDGILDAVQFEGAPPEQAALLKAQLKAALPYILLRIQDAPAAK